MGDWQTGLPDSHPLECVIPDGVLIQVGPPDDEHLLLETFRSVEINTLKKSESSWSLTRAICCYIYWECEVGGGDFFSYFALNQLLRLCSVALGLDCVT